MYNWTHGRAATERLSSVEARMNPGVGESVDNPGANFRMDVAADNWMAISTWMALGGVAWRFSASDKQWSSPEVLYCGVVKASMEFVRTDGCTLATVRSVDFLDRAPVKRHDDVTWSSVLGGATNHGRWTALQCFVTTSRPYSFNKHRQFKGRL